MCNCQPLLFVACLKAFLTDLHPMLGEKVEYATIVVEGHKMPIIIFFKKLKRLHSGPEPISNSL